MDKLVLILLVVLSSISLSHWWVATTFIDTYGLSYLFFVAIFQITILCSLFQAERIIVNETLGQSINHPTGKTEKVGNIILGFFLAGCFIASAVLATHNLIVTSWQMSAIYETILHSYHFIDYSLLIGQQGRIFGGLDQQMIWLLVSIAFFSLYAWCIYGSSRRILAPVLLMFSFVAFLLFFMLFFWQHTIDTTQLENIGKYDTSDFLVSAMTMAIEPSLAGFGVFFAFKFFARKNLEQSFLTIGMFLAVLLSAMLALGGWVLTQNAGDGFIGVTADRLIVLAPLYMESLPASHMTLALWTISSVGLSVIKTTLLSGVCLYIFSRYFFPQFSENKLLVPALISFMSIMSWFGTVLLTDDFGFNISTVFQDVFVTFFYYWTPLQIAAMCLLAFHLPVLAHSNLLPVGFDWLDSSSRWYYLALALFIAAFWLHRISGAL